jgi:chromosome segregation ATPase
LDKEQAGVVLHTSNVGVWRDDILCTWDEAAVTKKFNTEIDGILNEIRSRHREDLKSTVGCQNREIAALKAQLSAKTSKLRDPDAARICELEKSLQNTKNELCTKRVDIRELEEKVKELETTNASKDVIIKNLETEIARLRSEYQISINNQLLQTQLDKARKAKCDLESRITQMEHDTCRADHVVQKIIDILSIYSVSKCVLSATNGTS